MRLTPTFYFTQQIQNVTSTWIPNKNQRLRPSISRHVCNIQCVFYTCGTTPLGLATVRVSNSKATPSWWLPQRRAIRPVADLPSVRGNRHRPRHPVQLCFTTVCTTAREKETRAQVTSSCTRAHTRSQGPTLTWLRLTGWLHWEDDKLPKTLKFCRSSRKPATADFRASSCLAPEQTQKPLTMLFSQP